MSNQTSIDDYTILQEWNISAVAGTNSYAIKYQYMLDVGTMLAMRVVSGAVNLAKETGAAPRVDFLITENNSSHAFTTISNANWRFCVRAVVERPICLFGRLTR
jgi:hypothetical protein